MAGRKRKKSISKFTVFGVVVLVVVLCGTLTYKKAVLDAKGNEYSKKLEQLQKKNEAADKKSKELDNYKEYTNSKEFIEEVARDRLGLVYDDEIIFEPDNKD